MSTISRDAHTLEEHHVPTEDGLHDLYVQEWGNRSGADVMYLHGGPGSGCSDSNKNLFDPELHHVVFLDQRGAGNSTPHGSLEANTTDKLVEDIELVRRRLGLAALNLYGWSWGSTLALSYAIKYPEHVASMVIGGILMGTKEETDWVDTGGFRSFFPEVWNRFTEDVPAEHLDNPGKYHAQRAVEEGDKKSSYQYAEAQDSLASLDDRHDPAPYETYDQSYGRTMMHYVANECFLPPDYVLDNADKLTMPVTIIHGRYDMLCLPRYAHDLHEALPNSSITFTTAGHTSGDLGNFKVIKAVLSQLRPSSKPDKDAQSPQQ